MELLLYQRLVQDEKLTELLASYFLVLIFTLMLSKIFSEALSLSDKHNYKTFTKIPPGSLLHCSKNIFNHLSGKCRDSLTDNGCSEFHQVNWPQYHLFTDISSATAKKER